MRVVDIVRSARPHRWVAGLFGLSAVWMLSPAVAQTPTEAAAERGAQRFERHCALCHGTDGKGFGPFLRQLKTKPPNLRLLAKNNGGCFPLERVYDVIDGRRMTPSHGTRDMPIWGEEFKALVPGESQTLVQGRILEIVMYLRSIQDE